MQPVKFSTDHVLDTSTLDVLSGLYGVSVKRDPFWFRLRETLIRYIKSVQNI